MSTTTISTSSSIPTRHSSCSAAVQKQTDRPIWGVLTQPTKSEERLRRFAKRYTEYIPASFVRWLESGGARVIPIHYDVDENELWHIFKSINGVLFTGGEIADISNTPYGHTARLLYNWAKEANNTGDYFPLYGTCQGFQLLCQLAADNFTLKQRVKGCVGVSKPLEFAQKAKNSRIFGSVSQQVYHTLSTTPCGEHMHNYSIPPEAFKEHPKLGNELEILATNKDNNGKVFVSCVEGKKYPFWAGQFHPERNAWEWTETEEIDHSPQAILAMHHLAVFLVSESRKSRHHFPDKGEEEWRLTTNTPPYLVETQKESKMYTQTYFWQDCTNY